ncbi:MAG: Rieske 2Fe-2S domain-containing protein [Anaerolineae bacterium]|nr:Rieske 2Fe-2S domain-containing protein [Anaerolineae bacterium]
MTDAAVPVAGEQVGDEKLAMNRQEFLNLTWLASLGFLVLEISGVSLVFAYPRFKEGEFGGIFTFGPVSNLPSEGSPPANFPKVKLWLSHTEEGVVALYKVCPHLGCLYGWSDQEVKFICPCHGSQYKQNGDYESGPAPRSLDRFALQIVDGDSGEVLYSNAEDNYGPIDISQFPDSALVQINTGDKELGEVHD